MPASHFAGVVAVWLLSMSVLCAPVRAELPASDSHYHWHDQQAAQLSDSLAHEARRAFVWRSTWTAINAVVGVASIGGLFVLPASQRPSLIVGAISSGVSSAFTWILPLEVEADAERARALAELPVAERHERLRPLYAHAAQDESDRVQWPWHFVNLGLSLVPATIIWAGYRQFSEGMFTWLTGFALGELAILTQPTRLPDHRLPTLAAVRVSFTGRSGALSYAIVW